MELYCYILLIAFSSLTILTESQLFYKWLFLPSVFIFMIIVRYSGYDSDIQGYVNQLGSSTINIYYLREFVFWYGTRFVYFIFQDDMLSFLFLDFIWIFIMIKVGDRLAGSTKKHLNNGLFLVLMTSFPFVFGYENIYRQFYATVFLLFSYSSIELMQRKSIKLFVMAFFMHNIVVLLLPFFIIKKFLTFDFKSRVQVSIIISLLFVSLLLVLSQFKSSEETGVEMGVFYLLIFVLSLLAAVVTFRENIYLLFKKLPTLFSSVIIMTGVFFLNEDMVAERLGMIFISFFLYDLYKFSVQIESKGLRSLFRLGILLIFSLPTLFFASSKQFLM